MAINVLKAGQGISTAPQGNKRLQALAAALLKGSGGPIRTIGGGIGSLGDSVSGAMLKREADRAAKEREGKINAAYQGAVTAADNEFDAPDGMAGTIDPIEADRYGAMARALSAEPLTAREGAQMMINRETSDLNRADDQAAAMQLANVNAQISQALKVGDHTRAKALAEHKAGLEATAAELKATAAVTKERLDRENKLTIAQTKSPDTIINNGLVAPRAGGVTVPPAAAGPAATAPFADPAVTAPPQAPAAGTQRVALSNGGSAPADNTWTATVVTKDGDGNDVETEYTFLKAPQTYRAQLTTPMKKAIQKDMRLYKDQLSRLRVIEQTFDKELHGRKAQFKKLWMGEAAQWDLLDEDAKSEFTDIINHQTNLMRNLSQTLKEMSGAAVTPQEFQRIKEYTPQPKDDPVTAAAKLKNGISYMEALHLRTAIQWENGISLSAQDASLPLSMQVNGKRLWFGDYMKQTRDRLRSEGKVIKDNDIALMWENAVKEYEARGVAARE